MKDHSEKWRPLRVALYRWYTFAHRVQRLSRAQATRIAALFHRRPFFAWLLIIAGAPDAGCVNLRYPEYAMRLGIAALPANRTAPR